ncbi:hypothetical protein KKC97_01155, partial [bacterium]|nr:hypothetical protein [bacterium]
SLPSAQIIHFDAQASGYSTAKLARSPILDYRVLGMDRLWQKHRSPKEHARWQKLAHRLLKFRTGLLRLSLAFAGSKRKHAVHARIQELTSLAAKLKSAPSRAKHRAC